MDGQRRGLSRLAGGEWTTWTADDGFAGGRVRRLAVAPDGSVWAAGDQGVSRFAGGEWSTWTAGDGLGRDEAVSVAVADDGTVWAAVANTPTRDTARWGEGGLARFADGEWTAWPGERPLDGGQPLAVTPSGDGGVWVALRHTPTPDEAAAEAPRPAPPWRARQ